MYKRWGNWLLALGCIYLAAITSCHFAQLPGLHADEAWLGLYALNIRSQGISSLHEMNTYTGPFYGWIVSKLFRYFNPSIFALRLPGLLCNLIAAFLMTWHLVQHNGRRCGLAWLGLLAASALFVLKSRIAWEVYAFQNLLLALIVITIRRHMRKEDYSFPAILAFLAANYCGVFNHFIFLSVPLSLFIFLCAYLTFYRDRKSIPLFQLMSVNLFMCAILYLLKPLISDAFWMSHKVFLATALLAWPAVCAGFFHFIRHRTHDRIEAFWEGPSRVFGQAQFAFKAALGLGLALFFLYHWIPMMQIWSGAAILQRLFSWTPPRMLLLVLYAWASALLGTYFVFALRHLPANKFPARPLQEHFLVHWPLVYAALFIIFRNTNSIRYYSIPSFLLTLALAVILPQLTALLRWRILLPLLAVPIFLNIRFWSELTTPHERRPIRFYVGYHMESSQSFLDPTPLAEEMRREHICDIAQTDSFIDIPLIFLLRTRPVQCDPNKLLAPSYCWECAHPPYYRWQVKKK